MTKRFEVPIPAQWVYYDGQIVPADKVLVPAATNLGLRLGMGVFEAIRAVDGAACWLAHHAQRLAAGLRMLDHQVHDPTNVQQKLLEITTALAEKNGLVGGARFRVTVWLEGTASGYRINPGARLVWLAEAFPLAHDGYVLHEPIVLGMAEGIHPSAGRSNELKTVQAWPYTEAAARAAANGWDDALLLSAAGNVLETSRANVFLLQDGRLVTPKLDAAGGVAGVMRKVVLTGAGAMGMQVEEKAVLLADVLMAQEVFCTNVVVGITPVGRFISGESAQKEWAEHPIATALQAALLTKPALF